MSTNRGSANQRELPGRSGNSAGPSRNRDLPIPQRVRFYGSGSDTDRVQPTTSRPSGYAAKSALPPLPGPPLPHHLRSPPIAGQGIVRRDQQNPNIPRNNAFNAFGYGSRPHIDQRGRYTSQRREYDWQQRNGGFPMPYEGPRMRAKITAKTPSQSAFGKASRKMANPQHLNAGIDSRMRGRHSMPIALMVPSGTSPNFPMKSSRAIPPIWWSEDESYEVRLRPSKRARDDGGLNTSPFSHVSRASGRSTGAQRGGVRGLDDAERAKRYLGRRLRLYAHEGGDDDMDDDIEEDEPRYQPTPKITRRKLPPTIPQFGQKRSARKIEVINTSSDSSNENSDEEGKMTSTPSSSSEEEIDQLVSDSEESEIEQAKEDIDMDRESSPEIVYLGAPPKITIPLPQILPAEPPDDLIEAIEALTLSSVRMQKTGQLPFLRRNLRAGFKSRCKFYGIPTKPKRGEVVFEARYEHINQEYYATGISEWLCPICELHGAFDAREMLEIHLEWDHPEVFVEWDCLQGAEGETMWKVQLLIPEIQIEEESTTEQEDNSGQKVQQEEEDDTRRDVIAVETNTQVDVLHEHEEVPNQPENQEEIYIPPPPDTAAIGERKEQPESESLSLLQETLASTAISSVSPSLSVTPAATHSPPPGSARRKVSAEPASLLKLKWQKIYVSPQQHTTSPSRSRSATATSNGTTTLPSTRATTRATTTVSSRTSRTPRPPLQHTVPPHPYNPLGPAAQRPYLPAESDYGGPTVYYSCRPGGECLFDLLNTLPMNEFGVLAWAVLDREEEIYESDDVREEYKVMHALWARWITLNRQKFIANYLKGTMDFVNSYWKIIHKAAGWDALRYWLLMLLANRFLDGSEVAQVLKHYEGLTGMEFWYEETA